MSLRDENEEHGLRVQDATEFVTHAPRRDPEPRPPRRKYTQRPGLDFPRNPVRFFSKKGQT